MPECYRRRRVTHQLREKVVVPASCHRLVIVHTSEEIDRTFEPGSGFGQVPELLGDLARLPDHEPHPCPCSETVAQVMEFYGWIPRDSTHSLMDDREQALRRHAVKQGGVGASILLLLSNEGQNLVELDLLHQQEKKQPAPGASALQLMPYGWLNTQFWGRSGFRDVVPMEAQCLSTTQAAAETEDDHHARHRQEGGIQVAGPVSVEPAKDLMVFLNRDQIGVDGATRPVESKEAFIWKGLGMMPSDENS